MEPDPIEKISLPSLLEFASFLPASPKVFTRLSKLIEDENAALDYIASLVKLDPAIAAHILRISNSAYYGSTMKASNLEAAISRIGFKEIQSTLSTMIEQDCFYQALPCYGITASAFSDRAIEVAACAEAIAKKVGADADAPYLAGLLSEIGKLAINVYYEKISKVFNIADAAGDQDLATFERETLSLSHTRAGYELLKHWQFSPEIWTPIKNLREPTLTTNFVRTTAILVFARWVPSQIRGFDPDAELPADIKWAFKQLSIDQLDLASYVDDCRFEINDHQNTLSMML